MSIRYAIGSINGAIFNRQRGIFTNIDCSAVVFLYPICSRINGTFQCGVFYVRCTTVCVNCTSIRNAGGFSCQCSVINIHSAAIVVYCYAVNSCIEGAGQCNTTGHIQRSLVININNSVGRSVCVCLERQRTASLNIQPRIRAIDEEHTSYTDLISNGSNRNGAIYNECLLSTNDATCAVSFRF